jgi:hypothetical protein
VKEGFWLNYRTRHFVELLCTGVDHEVAIRSPSSHEWLGVPASVATTFGKYEPRTDISSLGIFKDAIIAILSALAKQEKVRISERTKAGPERTRRVNGTRLGRPRTAKARFDEARKLRCGGLSYGEIGKAMGISQWPMALGPGAG